MNTAHGGKPVESCGHRASRRYTGITASFTREAITLVTDGGRAYRVAAVGAMDEGAETSAFCGAVDVTALAAWLGNTIS